MNQCTNSPWCEPGELCRCEKHGEEMNLKPLTKHKQLKIRPYYRLAGHNNDMIQFKSTYSKDQGYIHKTEDIKEHGYKIVNL